MAELVLTTPIPPQIVNEMASFGPLDLKGFIQSSDLIRFSAELTTGESLPKGIILTSDGILTGIPAKGTQGLYEVIVTAENDTDTLNASFSFTVKPSLANSEADYIDKLKMQVWEAMQKNLPVPELQDLINLPLTKLDIYYILERWGTLTIWDAFNLDPPGEKHLLNLQGTSPHYNVYDRGSSLIMCPKDLFSEERTSRDAVQTAQAMAREIYKREWTIEMAGLDKWTKSAWVELQVLGDKYGKRIEIINYTPSDEDLRTYRFSAVSPSSNIPE